MSQATVCLDTELRKLRPAELYTLGQILNISDCWKKLMSIVPKEGTDNIPKFNAEHFKMIEQAVHQQRRNAAEIFLEEWGTMGKNRPTLRVLLDLLVKAELFRAADYLAGDVLKGELPKRPERGPAAPVNISDETIRKLLEEKVALCGDEFDESSLVLGSSLELSINKIVYPADAMLDAADQSSLERNMRSTKLASSGDKLDNKHLVIAENTARDQNEAEILVKAEMSDLIKFSTDRLTTKNADAQNNPQGSIDNTNRINVGSNIDALNHRTDANTFLPTCVYQKQEMTSQELPAFLNEFGQSEEQIRLNQELRSDELPVCINSGVMLARDLTSHDSISSSLNPMSDSLQVSNLNIDQKEMMSVELPQCVLDLGANSRVQPHSVNATNVNKHNGAEMTLTSQELPITVLEYHRV